MSSTSESIKDLVNEVEQPFISTVRDRITLIDDIVYGRFDYTDDLSPYLQQKVSVDADTLRAYKEQAKASLMDDLTLSLDLTGTGDRKETALDRIEALEAHDLMRLDPHGYTRDAIRHGQAIGLFFSGWLAMTPYIMPEQGKGEDTAVYQKRVESYRKAWFPFSFSPKHPSTVAFTEYERKITTATLRFRLPIIDLLERYSDDYEARREDPEKALRIFNEHFGFLRGDEPQSEFGERDLYRKEVEVCAADTGTEICHYVDMQAMGDRILGRSKGDRQYEGLGKTDYPNPFGAVSLILAEGVYNWWQPLAYRREPLLMALIRMEFGRSRVKSHWVSRALSPPVLFEELPSNAAGIQINEPLIESRVMTGADGKTPVFVRTAGHLQELERKSQEELDKFFEVTKEDVSLAAPRGLLFDPEGVNGELPASVVLADIDERNRLTGYAKQSHCNVWMGVLERIQHARKLELNKHRKKGDSAQQADWGAAITTSGQEWKVKGRVIERGTPIEVTAQDLDLEYTRIIEPVDNRAATVMARSEQAEKDWAAGVILYDDRLQAHGIENTSEWKQKKTEEQLYQLNALDEVMKTRLKVAEFTALLNGTTVEEVLGGLPEEMMPQIVNAMNPGMQQPASSGGPYQMASPATEQAGGAAVAVEGMG